MKRSWGWITAGLTALLLMSGLAVAGCEEEEPTDIREFTDGAGRSCSIDLHDISSTAYCDADPAEVVTCDAGQEPCFSVGPNRDGFIQNCGGCCEASTMTTFVASMTCATIQCTTDEDCLYLPDTCVGGLCVRE